MAEQSAIGVDLGGTRIRTALISTEGKLLNRREASTDTSTRRAPALQIVRLVRDVIGPESDLLGRISGIGVGVPGYVRARDRVWAPNLGWSDYPLRKELETELAIPVRVDSDRNVAILGETWMGQAQGMRNVVFFHVGTGIGAGILINGQLCRGHTEVAGAVGWLVTRRETQPPKHGVGSLEAHASGPAIAARALQSIRAGKPSLILELADENPDKITGAMVCKAATQGDLLAQSVLTEIGAELGIGIANLVSALNPELVVVGGGVASAWAFIEGPLLNAVRTWAQPAAAEAVRIVPSKLSDVGVLGAARLVFHR